MGADVGLSSTLPHSVRTTSRVLIIGLVARDRQGLASLRFESSIASCHWRRCATSLHGACFTVYIRHGSRLSIRHYQLPEHLLCFTLPVVLPRNRLLTSSDQFTLAPVSPNLDGQFSTPHAPPSESLLQGFAFDRQLPGDECSRRKKRLKIREAATVALVRVTVQLAFTPPEERDPAVTSAPTARKWPTLARRLW